MPNEKVVALLRVSTKQQTSTNEKQETDIPQQKQIIEDYVETNKWNLIKTFIEGGVSGFKNLASERDAIVSIIDMAKNKEFDILLVYHSNRLGRLADDTPQIIKELNRNHVRVISICEGDISINTQIDKVVSYIRYWQNENESVYKSETISDYHIAMVKEGKYRGGSMIPFGYKLVDNGSKNSKGRHIMDFVINDEEAEIVKLIFDLSLNKDYGQARTAKWLNENGYKTANGNAWHSTSIQTILNNPIYKGQFRFNSKVRNQAVLSPVREDLVIIQSELWNENRNKMSARKLTKTSKEAYNIEDARSHNSHGKLLLNGIAYCGYCGMKLTTMTAYSTWTTADSIKHKKPFYKYRCSSFYKRGGIKCDGQSTYMIDKLEKKVISHTKEFIYNLKNQEIQQAYIHEIELQIKNLQKQYSEALKDMDKLNIEINGLKNELIKIVTGVDTTFSKDLISDMLEERENFMPSKQNLINEISEKLSEAESNKNKYASLNSTYEGWAERFDNSTLEEKRIMLCDVIDFVKVFKNNMVDIKFKIIFDVFDCNNTRGTLTSHSFIHRVNL